MCGSPGTSGSFFQIAFCLLQWPVGVLLCLTIPDCRKPRLRKFYPITFIMCVVWIAISSYFVSWMVTVIGKWSHEFSYERKTCHLKFEFNISAWWEAQFTCTPYFMEYLDKTRWAANRESPITGRQVAIFGNINLVQQMNMRKSGQKICMRLYRVLRVSTNIVGSITQRLYWESDNVCQSPDIYGGYSCRNFGFTHDINPNWNPRIIFIKLI